jgi:hypothetical protein
MLRGVCNNDVVSDEGKDDMPTADSSELEVEMQCKYKQSKKNGRNQIFEVSPPVSRK